MNYKFSKNKNFYPYEYCELYTDPDYPSYSYEDFDIYRHLNGQDHPPISKLNKSTIFYELIEILHHIKFHNYKNICDFSSLGVFKELVDYKFSKCKYKHCLNIESFTPPKVDLFFFDAEITRRYLFFIIYVLFNNQNNNGSCIIRMKTKNIEFIYLLTTLFEKTNICKPDVMTHDNESFYVICQNYNNTYDYDLGKYIIQNMEMNIYTGIPCYFINIMNEIFTLIRQKYLFHKKNVLFFKCLDLCKLERLKNKNICDCIKWCQTYDIPYNIVKINIFNDKI